MHGASREITRMRQFLISTMEKPGLAAVKRMVRKWSSSGSTGQDAINRAVVQALDEIQQRIDRLIRI